MAKLSNTAIRRGIVNRLVNDADVTALVPADKIYGRKPVDLPRVPWSQIGVLSDTPVKGSCLDGQSIVCAVHNFAKGPDESEADEAGAVITASLDGLKLTIDGGYARIVYTGGQTLEDPVGWHRVNNLRITVYT